MSAGAQGVGSLSGGQQLQYVPLAAFDKKRSSFYGGADSSSDDDGDEDGEGDAEAEGASGEEEGGEESAEEGRSDGEDNSDDDDDDDGDDEEGEEEGEGGGGDEMRVRRRSGRTAPRYESEDSEDESDDAGRSIFTFNRKKRAKKGQSLEEEQHGYVELVEEGQEEEEEEEEVVEEAGVGTVAAAVDEEALKQMRLQKLLAKTDRIVNNINMSMTRYLEKEQAAAAAAAAEAEAAIDGNDEFGAPFSKPSIWPAVAATLQPVGLKQCLVQSPYSQLRDYQQGGVEWLRSLHIQGLNGILADEMGKFVYSLGHSCSQPF